MNTTPARNLAIVGRSSAAQPRTYRLQPLPTGENAAYRRLAAVILRLDVATLVSELRSARRGTGLTRAA